VKTRLLEFGQKATSRNGHSFRDSLGNSSLSSSDTFIASFCADAKHIIDFFWRRHSVFRLGATNHMLWIERQNVIEGVPNSSGPSEK
jgi:hypothetical protein